MKFIATTLVFTLSLATPAAADIDARTPTTVLVAEAASPLRDVLSSLSVPDSLRASVANAIGSATGSFTIYRADGIRPRIVTDIQGPVTLAMDFDFRVPLTGKLRIATTDETFTLSADAGRMTTLYTKTSGRTLLEESSVPVELKAQPDAAPKFVTLKKRTHQVTFANETELLHAKANGGDLLKSYEKRDITGGGQVFTKVTLSLDDREISRDDLRVFLETRAAGAPQI